jgi:hypothetical protein
MVQQYKKGKLKHAPAKVKQVAEHISGESAGHFASTKHTGLPERVAKTAEFLGGVLASCAEAGLDARHTAFILRESEIAYSREAFNDESLTKIAADLPPSSSGLPGPIAPVMPMQTPGGGAPGAPPTTPPPDGSPGSPQPTPPQAPVNRYDFRNDPEILLMVERQKQMLEKRLKEHQHVQAKAVTQ